MYNITIKFIISQGKIGKVDKRPTTVRQICRGLVPNMAVICAFKRL